MTSTSIRETSIYRYYFSTSTGSRGISNCLLLLLLTIVLGGTITQNEVFAKRKSPREKRKSCEKRFKKTKRQFQKHLFNWAGNYCYNFTFSRFCECLPEYQGPFNVVVDDGIVLTPLDKNVPTMDEIHSTIYSECIKEGCSKKAAATCAVDYVKRNDGLSYVSSVYIDKDERIADEEIAWTITNMSFCDTCAVKWRETKTHWEEKVALWNSGVSRDCYNFTFYRGCFCEPESLGPFEVVVKNGKIVSPLKPNDLPTMDDIYQTIFSNCVEGCPARGAVTCDVEYSDSTENGAPYVKSIFIDKDKMIADEELAWSISDMSFCSSGKN